MLGRRRTYKWGQERASSSRESGREIIKHGFNRDVSGLASRKSSESNKLTNQFVNSLLGRGGIEGMDGCDCQQQSAADA
jgi:hypothetical protein